MMVDIKYFYRTLFYIRGEVTLLQNVFVFYLTYSCPCNSIVKNTYRDRHRFAKCKLYNCL